MIPEALIKEDIDWPILEGKFEDYLETKENSGS
jgi:hypothetical protein